MHKYKIMDQAVIRNRVYSEFKIESSFKYKLSDTIDMVYSSWVNIPRFFKYKEDFKIGFGLFVNNK